MSRFTSFREFYPFYLSQHADAVCRNLHVVGTLSGASIAVWAVVSGHWWGVPLGLVVGYAFSWVGHFFFEKNKPATFNWPWYSFLGDWMMVWKSVTRARWVSRPGEQEIRT